MIYVTGDTHGIKDVLKFETEYFKKQVNKKDNYVLIAGDTGFTWNMQSMKNCINYFKDFKCTILFVDGNNDNFDILYKLPEEDFCGGKVHRVSNNIMHLERGYVYQIEGKKIFTFGGADSCDKVRSYVFNKDRWYPGKGNRIEHINWWKQEQPSKEEVLRGLKNLAEHDFKVDIILTHETTTKNVKQYFYWSVPMQTSKMLDLFYRKVDFKHWYFGHHHQDIQVSKVETCVLNQMHSLENLDTLKYKSQYDNLDVKVEKLTRNEINDCFKKNKNINEN